MTDSFRDSAADGRGGTPTFAAGPAFLDTRTRAEDAACCVAGIPFDLGTTNRAGARFGPQAVRHASRMLIDGDNPGNWARPLELPFADVGDFAIRLGETRGSLDLIERQARGYEHLAAIGGDHLVTLPLLRALRARRGEPVALVHFDAHVDTWSENFGQTYAHGTVFYHAITEGLVNPRAMIQVGIRSPVEREVWDWTLAQGVTVVTAEDVHIQGVAETAARIRQVVGGGPVYLSFDIDALDPSQAPGTGTPEVGGLFTWQAMALLRRLEGLDFVGMDVVEVAPAYDTAEITSLAGASVLWQYLSLLAANKG